MDLNLDPWLPADPDSCQHQARRLAHSRRQTRLLKLASDVRVLDFTRASTSKNLPMSNLPRVLPGRPSSYHSYNHVAYSEPSDRQEFGDNRTT